MKNSIIYLINSTLFTRDHSQAITITFALLSPSPSTLLLSHQMHKRDTRLGVVPLRATSFNIRQTEKRTASISTFFSSRPLPALSWRAAHPLGFRYFMLQQTGPAHNGKVDHTQTHRPFLLFTTVRIKSLFFF